MDGTMAWLYLTIAAAFEITFAMSMKYAEGFTHLAPTAVTVVVVISGITFLALSMRTLPLSVAYPVWTALGTVALGAALLGEALMPLKLA